MPRAKLLIADDDAPIRGLLHALLQREGYQVLEARTGLEALKQIRTGEIDVLLLDLMMAEGSGFDVVEQLRIERPQFLPCIIIITAASEKDFRRFLSQQEVFRVLRKPFDIHELLRLVEECLQAGPG